MTAAATADVEYRIVKLPPDHSIEVERAQAVGPDGVIAPSIAYGINELGVVVGMTYQDLQAPGSPSYRAFLWQDEARYLSLPVQQLVHMGVWDDDPSTPEYDAWSAAHDLNVSGDVVGTSIWGDPAIACSTDATLAFLWLTTPAFGYAQTQTLLRLDDPSGIDLCPASAASAISERANDGSTVTAYVAGMAWTSGCGLGDPTTATWWDVAATSQATVLPPGPTTRTSEAYGLNPSAVSTAATFVGATYTCAFERLPCTETIGDFLGVRWDGLTEDDYPLVGTVDAWQRSETFDVNDAESAVGYVEKGLPSGDCVERAALWALDGLGNPSLTELAESPIQTSNDTRAAAISSTGTIVGEDRIANLALRWSDPTTAETFTSLVDCPSCDLTDIRIATDVNGAGWVTGTATYVAIDASGDPVPSEMAVLLVPLGPCPADVDRDGDVDADDLAAVQAAQTGTGLCPPHQICWADVNGDCRVDNEDRKIVMQFMTQASCGAQTLSAPLAEVWLGVGGGAMLESDPTAPDAIEAAYDSSSELQTFTNLVNLVAGG